ncbi:hypothetical protein [Dysgonomonas sp. ZJ709]|uniref:hypothetical protein n=1 Tax=Dysgonomonas sp. ZJ709 TaxID=2709797 RepID=UPI0013EB42DA|nr:hypothetical protein [Dysgonomonas sp. ZJ709]
MDGQNKTSSRGRKATVKNPERMTQVEAVKQLLDNHKKGLNEVVHIKIDDRTYLEVPAGLSAEDRQDRIKNYLKYTNYKPV